MKMVDNSTTSTFPKKPESKFKEGISGTEIQVVNISTKFQRLRKSLQKPTWAKGEKQEKLLLNEKYER